jgi:hypothetical protein
MIEEIGYYVAGCATGGLVMFSVWRFSTPQPDADELRKHMERIVNMEMIEEHERLLKFRMARSGLRSMRIDGGPNAVLRRMRLNPRKTTGGTTGINS